jgi:type I restriction enzyme S subunit
MDTQKLKDKILQLAIQGKLVKQDPNDEPASELLKKIETEKKKLYKEGKIRKPKKLPPIKEEEKPFDIPESWEWVRMGNSCHIIMGQSPKGNTVGEEGIEFHQGKIFFGDKYLKESDKFTIKPKKIADIGDVILSVRAPVGTVNITERQICIGRGLCAVKPLLKIKTDFNYYWIKAFNETLLDKSTGTTFKAISMTTINELVIPLPPINEQIRVVEKIEQLFKLIDNLDSDKEQLLETIELTRNKVLQDAIQGKLVEQNQNDEPASELLKKIEAEKKKLYKEGKIRKPKKLPPIKDEEKPFDIPESWEWVRMGNSCNIIMGQSPKGNTVGEEGIEFHQGKIFFGDKYLKESDKFTIKPKKIAAIGDVILSVRAPVGTVNITKREICIGRGLCAIRPLLKIKTDFNYYWIKAFNETLLDKATGTTFKAISMTTINELVIPLPPLNEQKRIVEKIDEIFNYCDLLEELLQD